MKSQACMVCHYNSSPLDLVNLQRLSNFLSTKVDVSQVYRPNRYNWQSNNKCQYGMNCSKTHSYDNSFRRITNELDELLTGYIEQTDCSDYHEILRYLQGYQATVYREFEIDIRKHKSKE